MTREVVSFDRLRVEAASYVRAGWSEARVGEFVELLREHPEALPPIEAVPIDEQGLLVADGVHRWLAHQRLGSAKVTVEVLEVPVGMAARDFGLLHALTRSATGPLSPTPADRKRFCDLLFEHFPNMSDTEVAERAGMTRQGVWSRRNRGTDSPPDSEAADKEAARTYLTVDEAARVLVAGLARLDESKGLRDLLVPQRMSRHIAWALVGRYGEGAHNEAARFRAWLDGAVELLAEGS